MYLFFKSSMGATDLQQHEIPPRGICGVVCIFCICTTRAEGHHSIKMSSYQYRDSHHKDKSHYHHMFIMEIAIHGMTAFILRQGPDINVRVRLEYDVCNRCDMWMIVTLMPLMPTIYTNGNNYGTTLTEVTFLLQLRIFVHFYIFTVNGLESLYLCRREYWYKFQNFLNSNKWTAVIAKMVLQ